MIGAHTRAPIPRTGEPNALARHAGRPSSRPRHVVGRRATDLSPFVQHQRLTIRSAFWRIVTLRQFVIADCVPALDLLAVAFLYGGSGAALLSADALVLAAWG
jgi:hypothetical protein